MRIKGNENLKRRYDEKISDTNPFVDYKQLKNMKMNLAVLFCNSRLFVCTILKRKVRTDEGRKRTWNVNSGLAASWYTVLSADVLGAVRMETLQDKRGRKHVI